MRRFPLNAGSPSSSNGGIIIAPPPIIPPAPPAACPTVPALEAWQDLTDVFPCAAVSPADASIAGNVFTATPGADTASTYNWSIDVSAIDVPYLCVLVPSDEAIFEANFRFLSAAGLTIQAPVFDIVSPYFILRPDASTPSQSISAYQPNTSFGDASNGLAAVVTFRVLCLRIDPA